MKYCKRTLSGLLVLAVVLGVFGCLSFQAGADSGSAYRQKIVSVLYDNSGSMAAWDNRSEYARYALQTLMAMFSEKDIMIITPMNTAVRQVSTRLEDGIPVNLSAKDRNKEVERIIADKRLFPLGDSGTPSLSIQLAVEQLVKNGMKKSSQSSLADEDKEYWLVILTDGAFENQTNPNTISSFIEQYAAGYASMQTIYFGMSPEAVDLRGTSAVNSCHLTPKKVEDVQKIISTLQDISCQMLGRFPLDSSVYSVSDKTVTVDLSRLEYPLKSITVLTQDSGAKLKSVKYNNDKVSVSQSTTIAADRALGIKNGSVDVINGAFSSGKITLEFDANPNQLTVLIEPDLALRVNLEYFNGSQWVETNQEYVSMNLHPGDKIRATYEVVEQAKGTTIPFEKLFTDVQSSVSYNNTPYKIGDAIPLVENYSELLTTVTALSGSYFLRDTKKFNIESNPNFFRIDSTVHEGTSGNARQYEVEYTVYYDDIPVTGAQLIQSFSWDVNLTKDGTTTELQAVAGQDGKLRAVIDTQGTLFGKYDIHCKVTAKDNGRFREKQDSIELFPKSISLITEGSATLDESTYSIKNNTDAFTFRLVADDTEPLSFSDTSVRYSLTVDGTDVSGRASVNGDVLTFAPNANTLPLSAIQAGDHSVELVVTLDAGEKQLTDSKSVSFNVREVNYALFVLNSDDKNVNRFQKKDLTAAVYFTMTCDGQPVPASELQEMLDHKDLVIKDCGTFSWRFWFPCGLEKTVTEVNGQPAVACKVCRDWGFDGFIADLLSSFITDGEKEITATFDGMEAKDALVYTDSNVFEYIWRWLVLVIKIYLILWALGFIWAKNLPTGMLVSIRISTPGSKLSPLETKINFSWKKKWLWHLKRLIPTRLFQGQRNEDGPAILFMDGDVMKILPKSGKILRSISSENGVPLYHVFQKYRQTLSGGKSGKALMKDNTCGDLKSMFPSLEVNNEGGYTNKQAKAMRVGTGYFEAVKGVKHENIIFFIRKK